MNQVMILRYDNGVGYFWINDDTGPIPNMIMHTTAPALNGQLLDDPKYNVAFGKDKNLFGAFVDVTNTDADGDGNEKMYDKYDKVCEKTFDKYLDAMWHLPKYEQKQIEKSKFY